MSAEALFSLMDLCGLPPEDAIASGVQTARTVTRAAVAVADGGPSGAVAADRQGPGTQGAS